MATQTIEQNKEGKEASMTALVASSQSEARTVYPEPSSPVEAVQVEEEEITATPELSTEVSSPTPADGLLVRIARRIYDYD